MKPHLIVLDLDGTLLTDDKIISAHTKHALKIARAEGHQVMIATGRPYRASKLYYNELDLMTPIVNFNGAYVHHPRAAAFHAMHTPIGLPDVHDIVDSLAPFQLDNILAEVKDDVYIQNHDARLLDILSMGNPVITEGPLAQTLKSSPTSILLQAKENDVAVIRKHLADTKADLIDHRRWGDPWHVIEIVHRGIHKAKGVAHVSRELGIPRDRIIAFGDEDNDLEMIDYVGLGVAMDNAIPQLKNIANEITASNNEDGIAALLADRLQLKL